MGKRDRFRGADGIFTGWTRVRLGEIPHGTYNGYTNYRCRCDHCRLANNAFERDRKRRRKLAPDAAVAERNAAAVRARVLRWKAVHAAGRSVAVCDEIIGNRPIPARLFAAVIAA